MADNTSDGSNSANANTMPPPSTTAAVAASSSSISTFSFSSTSTSTSAAAATTTNPKEEWKALAPMTTPRFGAGGILIHDQQFLVIGGSESYRKGKPLLSCEYYNTKANTWNSFPINMPIGRFSFGVAEVGNRVYVMGGTVGSDFSSGSVGSDLISIDVSGNDLSALSAANKWDETLAPMNLKRSGFACVSHLNFIYVFGGYIDDEGEDITDTAERYNIDTNQWENLPAMPYERSYCSAGVVGNKIYVVGGQDYDDNVLAATIVFDTTKQQWEPSTTVPDMKTKRSFLSVVIVNHFVLAIGGRNEFDDALFTIEVLDTKLNSWNDAPTPMKHGRDGLVAGFSKDTNELIIAGGKDDAQNELKTADSISFEKGLKSKKWNDRGGVHRGIRARAENPTTTCDGVRIGGKGGVGGGGGGGGLTEHNTRKQCLLDLLIHCECQRQMHQLSQEYYLWRDTWYHFYPITILTIISGTSAFLASSAFFDSELSNTNEILTLLVGILSIILVAIQSCAKNSKYATKGEMHKVAVLALVKLISNINIHQIDPELGVAKTNKNNNRKQEKDEGSSDINLGISSNMTEKLESYRMVFEQIRECCQSPIPNVVVEAFDLVDTRLSIQLSNYRTQRKLRTHLNVEDESARSIFIAAAYNELCVEFSNTVGWPFHTPSPDKATERAIKRVCKTYTKSNFLDEPIETTSLLAQTV